MVSAIHMAPRDAAESAPVVDADLALRIGTLLGNGKITERWRDILLGNEEGDYEDVWDLIDVFGAAGMVLESSTARSILGIGDPPDRRDVQEVVEGFGRNPIPFV